MKKQAAPAETDLQAKAEKRKKAGRADGSGVPYGRGDRKKKESASCSCAVEARTKAESGGVRLPGGGNRDAGTGEILKELSRIGAEIDALNHRILSKAKKSIACSS